MTAYKESRMDTTRLYIDSRDRVSGDASEFEYQPSLDVTVVQESIAVLDTVLIPVSWYVVEEGVSDRIYVTEENSPELAIESPQSLLATMTMCTLWRQVLKKP